MSWARRSTWVFLVFGLAASLAGCAAKIVVTRIPHPGNTDMEGIFYALPLTVVRTNVPIVRADPSKGLYSDLTTFFFCPETYEEAKDNTGPLRPRRCDDGRSIITEAKTVFSLRTPSFSLRSEPDPDSVFMVHVKGGYFENKSLLVELTENGILTTATAEAEHIGPQVVTAAAKTVASFAAPFLLRQDAGTRVQTLPEAGQEVEAEQEEKNREKECKEKLASQVKRVTADELAACKSLNNREWNKFLEEKNKLEFLRAKIVEDNIRELLRRREQLISQVSVMPGETLKIMLKEIDDTVESLKKTYFFGSVKKKTWTAPFEVTPCKKSPQGKKNPQGIRCEEEGFSLFKFSKEGGVCEILNHSLIMKVEPGFHVTKLASNCNAASVIKVSITKDGENQIADTVSGNVVEPKRKRGFYFRIPGRGLVKVAKGEEPLACEKVLIAQFGHEVSLPASTGGRKTKYSISLYKDTGALRNIKLGSDSLIDKAIFKDVEKAGTTLLEATDDLKRLERQRKILEEIRKIREEEKKLEAQEEEEQEE